MTSRAVALVCISLFIISVCPTPALWSASDEGLGSASLPPPAGLTVLQRPEDAGLRIALSWEPVEGASGYRVYRSEPGDGGFEPVGGRSADSMHDYPVFLDHSAEPGKEYLYAVSSVDADMREGPLSPVVRVSLSPAARAAGGPKRMTCSLSDQRIYFFEGDQLVNIMRCSTGLRNATPTGHFRILAHYRVHVGLGGAVCDYWMSFTSRHGMHSWPRGSRSNYETGLGAPASHGCIRLHPLEAYWPYEWAPNGTPLTITYASLARRVVSGCHDSMGATAPSRDWYFAEGYTAEGFDTFILVANPGERPAAVEAEFMKEDASVVRHSFTVPPHTRHTITVDDVWNMEATAFSLHLRSSEPVVAERAVYFADSRSRNDGTVSLGATAPSRDWYFAEGYTAEGFDTFILVANPGERPAAVEAEFMKEDASVVRHSFTVPPHTRHTITVDDVWNMEATAFSLHLRSSEPVVAERAVYFRKGYVDGGHASLGATSLSTKWYFAEGCTRAFFEDYLLVGNPGDRDTVVHVEYQLPDSALAYDYVAAAGSRLTIPVHSQPGLRGTDVACSVTSDLPVVAERAMYYGLDSHRGGHATLGAADVSPEWYFAEGYTDKAFDTYILVSNPGTAPASVELAFHREDGSVFSYSYLVPPQRRLTVRVDDLTGLDRASFATRVRSDRPVVAERAMYFVMPRGY